VGLTRSRVEKRRKNRELLTSSSPDRREDDSVFGGNSKSQRLMSPLQEPSLGTVAGPSRAPIPTWAVPDPGLKLVDWSNGRDVFKEKASALDKIESGELEISRTKAEIAANEKVSLDLQNKRRILEDRLVLLEEEQQELR
jgi:hypothetical protein